MVAQNYAASLALVLKSEGGNVDDPEDAGGRTSRGVTQRVYDAYRRNNHMLPQDVYDASDAEIADIYHQSYWEPYCDGLSIGIDYAFFDFCVNSGPHRALVELQEAAGVTPDGVAGPVTWDAVNSSIPTALLSRFMDERRAFYRALNEARFLKGWLNRANAVQAAALKMMEGASS